MVFLSFYRIHNFETLLVPLPVIMVEVSVVGIGFFLTVFVAILGVFYLTDLVGDLIFQGFIVDEPPECDKFSVTFFSVLLVLGYDCLVQDYFHVPDSIFLVGSCFMTYWL